MTWERWRTICSLFDEAVRCAPSDRDNLLSERCAGDKSLRSAVERLLADDELARLECFPSLPDPSTMVVAGPARETPICPRCRAARLATDPADRSVCPACGMVYCPEHLIDVVPGLAVAFGPVPPAVETADFPGTSRFRVLRRLGAGGMGVVYEVYDRDRDLRVALKTIQHFDASALYRFKKEFRTLEDVVHPNFVRLWELFSEGGRWFFTMELVEGIDFLSYVGPADRQPPAGPAAAAAERPPTTERPTPETTTEAGSDRGLSMPGGSDGTADGTTGRQPVTTDPGTKHDPSGAAGTPTPAELDLVRLRSALSQLAGGLVALHAMGKLHRDLKPSNVMVDTRGRVVILDFGVAIELKQQDDPQATERLTEGTVTYMSPEQSTGRPLSPASDWYSVGVMLFRALTGQHPFVGTRLDVMARKQTTDAPDPRNLAADLPDDLAALCVDLLRRAPEERPTGEDVLRRLGAADTGHAAARGGPGHPRRLFLGRKPQLAALAEAFEAMLRGETTAVFVHGLSGSGKSSLVHHFLEDLAAGDRAVILEGRCFEQESVAYKALDALIDSLSRYLRRLPRLQAEVMLPRDIAALARVFAVLTRVEAVAGAPQRGFEAPDPQELRRRAFAALRELLARISDRRPLVLYIDDLQWGDLDSAELLSELLRPPDAPVLLLICCYRSEYARLSPCLARLMASGEDGGAVFARREVPVDAMPPDETRELARLLLARAVEVPDELAEMVARESGGSPYFVNELTRYLTGGGELSESLAPACGVSLDEVLWRRVLSLPPKPRRLLEAIAVAGRPIRQGAACRAAGLGSDGFDSLALLRAESLVRGKGTGILDEVEAYHDRIRETVVRRLSDADRASWNRQLAEVLEESEAADPETLAIHLEEAGQPVKAARYFQKAAEKAVDALAFDRAAKLYRRVVELRPADDDEGRALRARLAAALANAGRGAEAACAYQEAAVGAGAAELLDFQGRAAYQFLISGHIDEGLSAFREVLAQVALRRPETPLQAFVLLLAERAALAVRGLGFRDRAPEDVPVEVLTRVDTARAVAVGISVVDVIKGSYYQTRSLRLALQAGEPFRIALALGWEAVHSACLGRAARRRTERLIALAEQVAGRVGHPQAVAMATFCAGAAAYFAGRFRQACELLDRATALFRDRCTGVVWELDTTQVFGLWARIYLGELRELSARFQSLDQEARGRGDRYMESTLGTYPGVLARLAADDPADARALAAERIAQWSQQGFHVQHLTHYYGNTYIDLYEADGPAAWRRAESTWPSIRASLLTRIEHVKGDVRQCQCRSAVAAAAASANPGPLRAAAETIARKLLRNPSQWFHPAALLALAGVARQRQERARSVRLLEEAVARADAQQVDLFAAAARRRLGEAIGGEAGRELVARADAWMSAQAILNPTRMAACIAPGFPEA